MINSKDNLPKRTFEGQKLEKYFKIIQSALGAQTLASLCFLIIISFYTLYFLRELILPVIIAFLLYFLLYPFVRLLKKLFIPAQLGAILVLAVLLFIIVYGFYELSSQAKFWLDKAPNIFSEVHQKLTGLVNFLSKPMAMFSKIKDQLYSLISLTTNENIQQVKLSQPYFIGALFSNTWKFFAEFGMSFIVLYFLLASEDYYLKKIIKVLTNIAKKREAIAIVEQTEKQVWNYLFARTMINIGLAIVVSFLMYILDMPTPVLWGVMAGILEFIPFLGALVSTLIIAIVSIVSFQNILEIVFAPLSFYIVLIIEGNFIAPYVFGRSLSLNTLTIVLSIFFLGWIWGIMGALIAVPMAVILKIFLDNIYDDNLISELLSE